MPDTRTDFIRRSAAAVLLALVITCCIGCHRLRNFLRPAPPCVLQTGATHGEVVARVNQNFSHPAAEPLTAWQSTQVQMSMKGMPGWSNATIAVQAPHRVRIRASHPLTGAELADLGSNDEQIWFWGQGGPGVVTVRHEELPHALHQMQIPFEPDWLMEVLGVVPIDPEQFELVRPAPETGYVELVADRAAPTGEPVRRVIRVETCYGRVTEHRVESLEGQTIAVARLTDYKPDTSGRYSLPHFVKVTWPQAQTELTFRIGQIHTDAGRMVGGNWSVPQKRGYAQLRIGHPPAGAASATDIQPVGGGPVQPRSEFGGAFTQPILTVDEPPGAYSGAASQSSSDRPPWERASAPRPVP